MVLIDHALNGFSELSGRAEASSARFRSSSSVSFEIGGAKGGLFATLYWTKLMSFGFSILTQCAGHR
jgi:hypothetical protein